MKGLRLLLPFFLAAALAAQVKKTFRGEVMDSQCAKMGSHDLMMKKAGARDTKECTVDCFRMGGKYVLYDAAAKTIYLLDFHQDAQPFVGLKVNVTGVYDKALNTIHAVTVEPLPSPASSPLR